MTLDLSLTNARSDDMDSGLLERLAFGWRRSRVASRMIIAEAIRNPDVVTGLIQGVRDPSPRLRRSCAEELEKLGEQSPQTLSPHAGVMMRNARQSNDAAVRVAIMRVAPRLTLSEDACVSLFEIVDQALASSHRAQRLEALKCCAWLGATRPTLKARAITVLTRLMTAGSPSIESSAKLFLTRLETSE